ncbi:MAG: EamA family transporter [Gaiellales bacterium]
MGITILLGLACAVAWGLPDISLARAVRTVGIVPTVIGSILVGLVATSPLVLWAGPFPDPALRDALLVLLAGGLTLLGYMTAFSAFRIGKVSVVAPIIACEGAVAAVAAIVLFGEQLEPLILLLLPVAIVGVVLAAMSGDGEGRGGVVRASAAALVWGGILLTAAPVADAFGVLWGFLLVRLVALVLALPIGLALGTAAKGRLDWRNVAIWGVGDSVASLLYVAAADRGPVAVAGVLAAQFATVAAIAGVVLLKERLRARQWAGVVLVLLAVTGIAATGAA